MHFRAKLNTFWDVGCHDLISRTTLIKCKRPLRFLWQLLKPLDLCIIINYLLQLFQSSLKCLLLLNLAQHLQPYDNFLAPLLLSNICGKMTCTPPVYKWRVPLKKFFSTVKQTTVTVWNHANGSTRTKYFLSDKGKEPWPVLVVLTLD
jgi:hypothetical protein